MRSKNPHMSNSIVQPVIFSNSQIQVLQTSKSSRMGFCWQYLNHRWNLLQSSMSWPTEKTNSNLNFCPKCKSKMNVWRFSSTVQLIVEQQTLRHTQNHLVAIFTSNKHQWIVFFSSKQMHFHFIHGMNPSLAFHLGFCVNYSSVWDIRT